MHPLTLRRSPRGFTLIELLVVIAIIAILAAILFPVFAQAREKARQSACLSNMKQIGTAVLMYTQDYDESIVPSQNGISGVNLVSWPTIIQPYIKNAGVFVCPSASETPQAPDSKYINNTANRRYMGVTKGTTTAGKCQSIGIRLHCSRPRKRCATFRRWFLPAKRAV